MRKNPRIIIFAALSILIVGILVYWQANKHSIIETGIQKTVDKKSESLYSVSYERSYIDELNGNASFYNVILRSDTNTFAAKKAKNIFRAQISEVMIEGVNVIQLLGGRNLKANSIHFIDPVFHILKKDPVLTYTKEDTLALYEQMLGKFKSIEADKIIIHGGQIKISDEFAKATTTVRGIHINLSNFKIDSTRDYENLVSYFIRGLEAGVDSVTKTEHTKKMFSISGINYSASKQTLNVKNVKSFRDGELISTFLDLSLNGMETSTFLREQRIVANELKSAGGNITLYTKRGKSENTLEVDSTVSDRAKIKKVVLGKTRVVLIDKDKVQNPPVVLTNVELSATDIPEVDGSLTKLIAKSNWIIRGDGMTRRSKGGLYDIIVGPYNLNKAARTASIESLELKPRMTEAEFIKTRKVREDYVRFQSKQILFNNVDLQKVFAQRILQAGEVSLQPDIKIFKDKTLPKNTKRKASTDPAEVIRNLPFGISMNRINVREGHITYKERGEISGKTGIVTLENINGVFANVTNLPTEYRGKPQMHFRANTNFLGLSKLETSWEFALNKAGNPFKVKGRFGTTDGTKLNVVLEPLSMISVKEGNVNELVFETDGNGSRLNTKATLFYDHLKVSLLRKENDRQRLQKKTALSFLANIFIHDRNPEAGKIRNSDVVYPRDSSRSFINAVSQSLFLAIRKTITKGIVK